RQRAAAQGGDPRGRPARARQGDQRVRGAARGLSGDAGRGSRPGARGEAHPGGAVMLRWFVTRWALAVAVALAGLTGAAPALAGKILVPMDLDQRNHLKAYGLAYWSLQQGANVEWLLNYRGGSFLMQDLDILRRRAAVLGVDVVDVDAGDEAQIRA